MNAAAANPFAPRALKMTAYGFDIGGVLDIWFNVAMMFTYAAYVSDVLTYEVYVNSIRGVGE
jgi:hypothetical protein